MSNRKCCVVDFLAGYDLQIKFSHINEFIFGDAKSWLNLLEDRKQTESDMKKIEDSMEV